MAAAEDKIEGSRADPIIRAATAQDAPFLAWAIATAALGAGHRSVWEVALSATRTDLHDFLAALVLAEPECAAHYSGFVIGELEGAPVAAACGFIPAERTPEAFTEALLGIAARLDWSGERQIQLLKGFSEFNRCLPMTRSDHWVLEYIATKPHARGTGVTRAVLQDALECGREAGATVAEVAYFIGNERARRAYEKVGFQETDRTTDADFERLFGSPGVVHLRRDL
jgi:GNAT superfamily N-acetyltransferase